MGRGALDNKGLVIMVLGVAVELKRSAITPEDDIVVLFLADEEAYGTYGAKYMTEQHPDLVNFPYVINEGGGMMIDLNGEKLALLNNAEKGAFGGRITFSGIPGHGSMPKASENPLEKVALAIKLLANHQTKIEPSADVLYQIEKMGSGKIGRWLISKQRLEKLLLNHPPKSLRSLIPVLDAMIRPTIVVTIVNGGNKINVIPGSAYIEFDCRVLPGQGWDTVKFEIDRALKGKVQYKLEPLDENLRISGNGSSIDTPLAKVIKNVINEFIPNSTIIPFQVTGATDNRYFRNAFTSVAYGFMPTLIEGDVDSYVNMVHGRNERISIDNLVLGTSMLFKITQQFCSS